MDTVVSSSMVAGADICSHSLCFHVEVARSFTWSMTTSKGLEDMEVVTTTAWSPELRPVMVATGVRSPCPGFLMVYE